MHEHRSGAAKTEHDESASDKRSQPPPTETKSTGALRDSEELFRTVAETAIDAIICADSGGRITYFNKAAESMFGYDAADTLGMPLTRLMPERYREAHEHGLEQARASGRTRVVGKVVDVAGRRRDGSEFPLELSLARWTTNDGDAAYTGILRDVSERHRAEEALQHAHAALEARVEERTASLTETNRRLEQEVAERERAEHTQRLLARELDHRVKNMLATVHAVAKLTVKSSASLEEFGKCFAGRVESLARIHTVLDPTASPAVDLQVLVETLLAPFRQDSEGDDRIRLKGDALPISSCFVRTLGMALYELATNAVKYGSLSAPRGQVEVSWRIEQLEESRRLHLTWAESGGPPVAQPAGRGTGSLLVEEAIPYELGGTAKLVFAESGLRCEISVPLEEPETTP